MICKGDFDFKCKYTSPSPPLSPDEPVAGIKIHFHFKETGRVVIVRGELGFL